MTTATGNLGQVGVSTIYAYNLGELEQTTNTVSVSIVFVACFPELIRCVYSDCFVARPSLCAAQGKLALAGLLRAVLAGTRRSPVSLGGKDSWLSGLRAAWHLYF